MIGWERFEVKASTQWAMASTPVAAVTKGGTETVSAGSMIAMSASICDALGRDLVHRRRVGDQRAGADLAAGAGGGRDLGEDDAAGGRAVRAGDVGQALVAGDEDGDELGEVHGAAAAEADDGVGIGGLGGGDGGLEVGEVGLGLHVAEEGGFAEGRGCRGGRR